MKIKLLKPFRAYIKGAVLEVPSGQAREMIACGYAVEDRQRELLDTAAIEPEVQTADATPKRRRRS